MSRSSFGKCLRVLVAGFVWMGLSPASVNGIEPSDVLLFSKGPLLLRPQLGLSETYNDNLFAQERGQSDFISTISPGVTVQLGKLAEDFVSFDYGYSHHFYADRSELNSGEHSIGLSSRFRGGRVVINGSDSVQLLSSPVGQVSEFFVRSQQPQPAPGGGGSTPTPNPGEIPPGQVRGPEVISAIAERNVDRVSFSDSYNLGYAISDKTGIYVQGLHSTTDYEQGISLYDINTLRGVLGFGFQAFPKTALFGEVYYGQTATTPNFLAVEDPHVEFIGGYIGMRGEFTSKLSGVLRVGYEAREFSDDTPAPSSPVVGIDLTHQLSDKTFSSVGYSRLHDVSVQFAKESYTADVVSLQLSQFLGASRKWRAAIGGRYGVFNYETSGLSSQREYDQYSVNFNLAYQIQLWLSVSLGYTFDRLRTDSAGLFDYDINRFTVGVVIGY